MLTLALGLERLFALFCRFVLVVIGAVTFLPALLVACVCLVDFWSVILFLIGGGYFALFMLVAACAFLIGAILIGMGEAFLPTAIGSQLANFGQFVIDCLGWIAEQLGHGLVWIASPLSAVMKVCTAVVVFRVPILGFQLWLVCVLAPFAALLS